MDLATCERSCAGARLLRACSDGAGPRNDGAGLTRTQVPGTERGPSPANESGEDVQEAEENGASFGGGGGGELEFEEVEAGEAFNC